MKLSVFLFLGYNKRSMIAFEEERSSKERYIYHQDDTNLTFPFHVHDSFEFFILLKGKMKIIIDFKPYILEKNQAVLILPQQIHSYESLEENSVNYLCVFSKDYVADYYHRIKGKVPSNALFTLGKEDPLPFIEKLKKDTGSYYEAKSLFYHLIACFDKKNNTYEKKESETNDFVPYLLNKIQSDYQSPLTLKEISKEVGYSYTYCSSIILKTFHQSFKDLLNSYRLNIACMELSHSTKKISDIAFSCGFNSLRQFNRVFMDTMKTSPSLYRQQSHPKE